MRIQLCGRNFEEPEDPVLSWANVGAAMVNEQSRGIGQV